MDKRPLARRVLRFIAHPRERKIEAEAPEGGARPLDENLLRPSAQLPETWP